MQKSQGAKSTARRRPLRVLSSNRAPHPPDSLRRKRAPPPASPTPSVPASVFAAAASAPAPADAAFDRLLLARSDLAGLVSQIDELVSSALQCQTMSDRGKQEIESFSCFLSTTNSSLKQWPARLRQAFEAPPVNCEDASNNTLGTCSVSTAKGNGRLLSSSNNLPNAAPAISPSCRSVTCSTNLAETNLVVSPSPLVSWRGGACMVDSGKQLFLLTPLPKAKTGSSRCPGSSKAHLKTPANMDQLNLPNLPVWKVTVSDNDCPKMEKNLKGKEEITGIATPQFIKAKQGLSEDQLLSPFSFSIQKSRRVLPSPFLKTALSSRKQQFSPISEGSRREDILSTGQTNSEKPSGASSDLLSDEISKDLASRFPEFYGFNHSTSRNQRSEDAETLDWFLSPPKTCVLMDLPDDKPVPTPEEDNKSFKGMENIKLKGTQEPSDDKLIHTPAVHSKALLGTPWKGLESTNLKGRVAGETTLKKELWTRFEAVSTNELHFDKSVFHRSDGRRFIDMLEEAS